MSAIATHTDIYICKYVWTHMVIYIYIYIYTHTHTHTYTCIHMHVNTPEVCMLISRYICTYAVHIHIHMCVHIGICV